MDVVPFHGGKRHEMGDCFLVEGKGVGSSLSRAVAGTRHWPAIGLVVEVGGNLASSDS